MKNLVVKKCMFVMVALLVLANLMGCAPSPDQAVREVVSGYVKAGQDGDFDLFRKYCCGFVRDNALSNLVVFVSSVEPVAIAAEANGEGSYASLMDRAMETYAGKQAKRSKEDLKNAVVSEEVNPYPGYEDVCRMVDVVINQDTTTFFVHKADGKWLISYFEEKKNLPSLDEDFYANKVLPQEKFSNTDFYDLNTELTWRKIETYFK